MGRLICEGYMVKILHTGFYLGVGSKTRMPTIFLTKKEAEQQEVLMHMDPVNAALDTKVVKIQIREVKDENSHRNRQRNNGINFRNKGREMPCFSTDSSEKGAELHEEEGYHIKS